MEDKKSFINCLCDFSFTDFLTLKIIKPLYLIGIGVAALAFITIFAQAFKQSFAVGLLFIIASVVVPVLIVIVWRIALEMVITTFRIEENTRQQPQVQQAAPATAPAPAPAPAPAEEPEENEPPATIADL
jgi:hypothetical protein